MLSASQIDDGNSMWYCQRLTRMNVVELPRLHTRWVTEESKVKIRREHTRESKHFRPRCYANRSGRNVRGYSSGLPDHAGSVEVRALTKLSMLSFISATSPGASGDDPPR